MNKRFRPLAAFLLLAIAMMACALPSMGSNEPTADQVSTVVALTMQALTPVNGDGSTPEPAPEDSLLPHTLYYLANGSGGTLQVFRMEKDGQTTHQVTTEPVEVGNYGVSQVDGTVAYVVNNQLVLINADGSGRRVLVEGGPVDENNPFVSRISNPVFSPDGQTLAYGHNGLNLYNLSTGAGSLVLENQIDEVSGGLFFPKELYSPDKFSPDGTRLAITLGYYEGASAAVYYPESRNLVRLTGAEGALICCGDEQWTVDGSAFYSASPSFGMFLPGLWRVDAATGAVTTLIPGEAGGAIYNTSDAPHLGPDGQLYFFYAQVSAPDGFVTRAPLQLVRSAPDGVTGRTVLGPTTFNLMNEALWAPDASFVITADAPNQDVYQGGVPFINYTDGRPGVQLAELAQQMKWGP